MDLTTRGGYANVAGDYAGQTRKGWAGRLVDQAAFFRRLTISGHPLDWFLTCEMHAEDGAYLPFAKALGADYTPLLVHGGNLLWLHKPAEIEVLHTETFGTGWSGKAEGDSRSATIHALRQADVEWAIGLVHNVSGKEASEVVQTKNIVKAVKAISWRVEAILGDFNDYESTEGQVRDVYHDAGYDGLRERCTRQVAYSHVPTGPGYSPVAKGKNAKWIEDILTSKRTTVPNAKGVPFVSPKGKALSDHRLALAAEIVVKAA